MLHHLPVVVVFDPVRCVCSARPSESPAITVDAASTLLCSSYVSAISPLQAFSTPDPPFHRLDRRVGVLGQALRLFPDLGDHQVLHTLAQVRPALPQQPLQIIGEAVRFPDHLPQLLSCGPGLPGGVLQAHHQFPGVPTTIPRWAALTLHPEPPPSCGRLPVSGLPERVTHHRERDRDIRGDKRRDQR